MLTPVAHAAFLYHDSAATDGGEFNATFAVENLNNGGHTSHVDTENASAVAANLAYATANPPTAGYPVTITLEFNAAVNLDEFYLWNHSHNGVAGAINQGAKDFTLSFYDGAGGTGNQIGIVYSDSAAKAPATGLYSAEVFVLGATYSGVRSIVFTADNHNPGASFVGIREIGFNQLGALSAPIITLSRELIASGESVDLDISFDPSVDTAVLSTPGGPVDLKVIDVGDAVPGDGMVSLSESPISTYTYQVDLTQTGLPSTNATREVRVFSFTEPADNAFSIAVKGDSPLFYYRFEETAAAGYLFDSSGNGLHTDDIVGTLGQGSGPGGMNLAGECPGNVGILVPGARDMSQSVTLCAVINASDVQPIQGLFSMTDGTGIGRSVLLLGSGTMSSFITGASSAGTTMLPVDTSCLVHMVYDADTGDGTDTPEIRFYINGALAGVVPIGGVAANVGNWVLGSQKERISQFFDGWLDEAAVFEAVLSAPQIAAHGTMFFAAADPLLGFVADTVSTSAGEPVTLTWKTSDQASAVTLNGNTVAGAAGGGFYTTVVNPGTTTTYTLVVSGPGGPIQREITVSVAPSPDGVEKVIVYLLGGQSNADGYGTTSELDPELQTPQVAIEFYHGNAGGQSPLAANQWIALQPGSGSKAGNAGAFGPELGLATTVHNACGSERTRIALIKHTLGSSSLFSDWIPGGDATTSGDGPIYQDFQATVSSALSSLATIYPTATIQLEGMAWHQGEADASSAANFAVYETNLTNFIADIRVTYGSGMKFGIVQLSDNQVTLDPTRRASVKQAQANVATGDPSAFLVISDDLPTIPGNTIHFGTTSVLTIGERLAVGITALPLTDTDGNGLDDVWEELHWGPGNFGQDPNGDDDLDGLSNNAEFLWLTNPLSANLLNTTLSRDGANVWSLTFPSNLARRYKIEYSTDLNNWVRLVSFLDGVGGAQAYELPTPTAPQMFYRVASGL